MPIVTAKRALHSHWDEALGAGEEQTEMYRNTLREYRSPVTQRFAQKADRVNGFAVKQVCWLRMLGADWADGLVLQAKYHLADFPSAVGRFY